MEKEAKGNGNIRRSRKSPVWRGLFKSEELIAYVQTHPFATLAEIAAHFGGSTSGVHDALKREGISLKKQHLRTKNEMKPNAKHLTKH